MHVKRQNKAAHRLVSIVSAFVIFTGGLSALAHDSILSSVAAGGNMTRYAAGDSLPVAVTLTNYGANGPTDVVISYSILDPSGHAVYSESETVAVETAASFMRSISLPRNLKNGEYALTSAVFYPVQTSPATSSFKFTIESKFLGVFVNNLIIYLVSILAIAIVSALIGKRYAKKRVVRNAPLEYEKIPARERIFYEIASDIIAQIRYRIGGRALELAGAVQGLKIDERTGRVLAMTKDPAEVIAMLIYHYEKFLGTKIITTPEPLGKDMAAVLRPVNKNLSIIEKYFKINHK